jgi:hypothetical protein
MKGDYPLLVPPPLVVWTWWRYQGHSLNARWSLNTHPYPPPQTSFTSIFIPTPNQHNQMQYIRNSTINKGFTTRCCGLPLYILFCHRNVSPRLILLRMKKATCLYSEGSCGRNAAHVATIWIWSLSVVLRKLLVHEEEWSQVWLAMLHNEHHRNCTDFSAGSANTRWLLWTVRAAAGCPHELK